MPTFIIFDDDMNPRYLDIEEENVSIDFYHPTPGDVEEYVEPFPTLVATDGRRYQVGCTKTLALTFTPHDEIRPMQGPIPEIQTWIDDKNVPWYYWITVLDNAQAYQQAIAQGLVYPLGLAVSTIKPPTRSR